MNQNANEAESFAGAFVVSEEGLLFFEVPIKMKAVLQDDFCSECRIGCHSPIHRAWVQGRQWNANLGSPNYGQRADSFRHFAWHISDAAVEADWRRRKASK